MRDHSELDPPETWAVFNVNRKGTVLYFCDSSPTGQSWMPIPHRALRLSYAKAREVGERAHGVGIQSSWLAKIQPREIAGMLRAIYRDAKDGRTLPRFAVNFLTRTSCEPVERQVRNVVGDASASERPS